MKHSRRGMIIDLLSRGKTDEEILTALEMEFPPGTFKTSNRQALAGTKRDLGISNKKITTKILISPTESINKSDIDYRTYFKDWKNWETFESRFDGINGVYSFRLTQDLKRLKGTSNVLYIGMANQNPETNTRPGIWHRLMNYRQNNSGASRRLKEVIAHFGGLSCIEYSYCQCKNPREVEKMLLENYFLQHLEIPPLNRAG